jgi:hypothetical protein
VKKNATTGKALRYSHLLWIGCGMVGLSLVRPDMNNTQSKTNSESDKNWYCETPHAFECTREKIGALMGVSRFQG